MDFEIKFRLMEMFKWDYWTYEIQPKFWLQSLENYFKAKLEIQKNGGGDTSIT